MSTVKQVIILRTKYPDGKGGLKGLRLGKFAAMAAHASLKVFMDRVFEGTEWNKADDKIIRKNFIWVPSTKAEVEWMEEGFAKIVVGVESEVDLIKVYHEARDNKIICALICDSGKTEFNGTPTYTSCAIGPDYSDVLDKITGNLKLL